MKENVLVFLCIAQIIVCATVITGPLANKKLTRLVVEKYEPPYNAK